MTKKIKDILTIGSGRDYKHLSEGNIPVYGTGGYMTSVDNYLYNGESVCIGRKGTINKPIYLNEKFWTVDTLFYTHSFINTLPKFVFFIFEQINWLKYNEASGVPSLSKTAIEQIELTIASFKEQEKIASFLSLIDERIVTQNKIIEELSVLKTNTSKKLFSQELYFKEKTKKWKEVRLDKIATFFSGGTPLTSKREFFDGNIPFIRSGEINSYRTELFISELGLNKSSAKMVEVGDVLYALYGATSGEVGISKIKGAINQAILCIRSSENNYFIYSYLLHKKESIIATYLQGGQGNLSAEIVKQIKIPLPPITIQNKVEKILNSIDNKIKVEKQILNSLNKQKDYLLQQMFI